ncbi:MAG: PilC/PilY family type IV pilus protein, partial [Gammaproteobacteria bacterium]
PAIVRMHNGVWAAVFGNGYNNRDTDDHVSTTGNAVLYIVDISDGSLIRKFDTGVGDTTDPNGLATPAVVDINGDNIADVIYVGDLRGNLWKIDVNDADKDEWEVAYGGDPLFTATDGANPQPITSRPEVGRGPFGTDLNVYFGTGQYLGSPDTATTSVQTFYAIIDKGIPVADGRTNLLEQTVIF